MKFNVHSNLAGEHSFLGASKHSWLNYDISHLKQAYEKQQAAEKGTRLHALAKECIEMKVRLPNVRKALNLYVNDAIGFRMVPEQVLYFSVNAFGTADAISFRDGLLRIHDLKTGAGRVSMKQLEIYAAYFCLEYEHRPNKISMELRIYQSDEILAHRPNPVDILTIMEKIVSFDKAITSLQLEE